jgi:hypothetical protein
VPVAMGEHLWEEGHKRRMLNSCSTACMLVHPKAEYIPTAARSGWLPRQFAGTQPDRTWNSVVPLARTKSWSLPTSLNAEERHCCILTGASSAYSVVVELQPQSHGV